MSGFIFVPRSGDEKTGPVAASYCPEDTCADRCPFKGRGCYADNFRVRATWDRCETPEALSLVELTRKLEDLPTGRSYRHGIAGDLPGHGDTIDYRAWDRIQGAAGHLGPSWAYSHKPLAALRRLRPGPITVNVSADTPEQADDAIASGLPACLVVPEDAGPSVTPGGNRWIICPAQTRDDVTCATCLLCARPQRTVIVAFRAHGQGKRKLEQVLREV